MTIVGSARACNLTLRRRNEAFQRYRLSARCVSHRPVRLTSELLRDGDLEFFFYVLFVVVDRNPSHDKRLSESERAFIAESGGEPGGRPVQKTPDGWFWNVLRQRRALGLTFGFAAYGYLFNVFITWLPSYLSATFHINILKAAGDAAIAWGTATVTDLAYLADRLIRAGKEPNRVRLTVLIGGMVAGIAVIGAAYTTDINAAVFRISISLGGLAAPAPAGWSIPGFIVAQTGSFALALLRAGVVLALGIVSYVVVMGKIEPIPEPVA
jgi:ACS family D-galactonate transporter-like MFS transporter